MMWETETKPLFTSRELAIIASTLTTYARGLISAQQAAADASWRQRTVAEHDDIATLFALAQRAETASRA